MFHENFNVEVAKTMLKAIENGQLDALKACFTDDAMQTEWPNILNTSGSVRKMKDVFASFEMSQKMVKGQSYDIQNIVENGGNVSIELIWTGVFIVGMGPIKSGDTVKSRTVIMLDFKDGKIHRQRNYDCFYKE